MYANAINVRTLVIAAAVAMLVALGSAGIAYANGGDDSEEQLTGPDAQKAKNAAIAAVGGGTVSEVERDDGYGTGGFEVEVKRDDGVPIPQRDPGELEWLGAPRERWQAFCDRWALARLKDRPHRWRAPEAAAV